MPPEVTSVRFGVPDSTVAVSGVFSVSWLKYEASSVGRVTEERGEVRPAGTPVGAPATAVVAARAGAAARPPSGTEAAEAAKIPSRLRLEVWDMRAIMSQGWLTGDTGSPVRPM
ncbi:hypothetical protein GCM10010394_17110 [Streptomyces crystallinus]|uniref:Uncharacterized protein n=1 Tax=Streptomyces crystallinus TaxID=68191 RepID=A0ABP3QEH4_9ACTN